MEIKKVIKTKNKGKWKRTNKEKSKKMKNMMKINRLQRWMNKITKVKI